MASDNQRRSTQKLGRVRRDPRTDSVPPAAIEERVSDGARHSGRPVPRVSIPMQPKNRPSMVSMSDLEAQLARERAERSAEAGQIGHLLARVTQAESKVKQLESLVSSLIDQRSALEAEVTTQRHGFAAQLMEQRQALENLAAVAKPTRNKLTGKLESVASLTSVRTMATEMLRLLEKIDERDGVKSSRPKPFSEPPRRKMPSQPDTVPPRARSQLPETMPPRSRTSDTAPPRRREDAPASSRRYDTPTRPPRP
ncbi:hypothetical protein BH09MYX1_BH09MYX1_43710 [soil metagenome]